MNLLWIPALSPYGTIPAAHGQHHDPTSFPSARTSKQQYPLQVIKQWHAHHFSTNNCRNANMSRRNSAGPRLPYHPLHCTIRGTCLRVSAKETQRTRGIHVHCMQRRSAHHRYEGQYISLSDENRGGLTCCVSPLLGGDAGHALCLQQDLEEGFSEVCDTFKSKPLCKRNFRIQALEVWGIQNSISLCPGLP